MQNLGEWRVHADTNEVIRPGERVRLEPKVMDVLVLLLRNRGRVVPRSEFLDAVWPGVVVGDEALSQAVIKLRRALRDDARSPRYIETIPKRGYRLIAECGDGRQPEAMPAVASHRRLAALGAVAALSALALHGAIRDDAAHAPAPRMEAARNAEAQTLFERGRSELLVRGAAENAVARTLFRQSIERDPTFARAYAGLAMTYALESRLGGGDHLARAFELAETALLIDPQVAAAHWVQGFVLVQGRRHREAIASLERAIELDPSFADAYALLGGVYTYVGQPRDSIPLLRTALRLNPEGGYLYFLLLGRAYLFDGYLEQAIINLRAAALRNPSDVETRAYLAAALAAAGQTAGAQWEGDEVRSLRPDFSAGAWLAAYPMVDASQERRLASLLADAGLR